MILLSRSFSSGPALRRLSPGSGRRKRLRGKEKHKKKEPGTFLFLFFGWVVPGSLKKDGADSNLQECNKITEVTNL